MKFIAHILYIIVIALNAIPDEHHSHDDSLINYVNEISTENNITNNIHKKHHNHNHSEDSGLCSPFCFDDCCSTPVIISFSMIIPKLITDKIHAENDIITNYKYSSAKKTTPPPKTA